ncbi:hypothetical protein ACKKBG_A08295 [Auxenochlorella protothecoides x Auxenochlorella symbiontica]
MVLQARSSDTGAHNNDGSARLEAMRHLIDSKDEEIECLRQRLAAVLGGGSRLADPSMRVNGGGEVACPRTRCSDPEAEKLRVRVDALTAAHAAQALELKRAEERAAAAETQAKARAQEVQTLTAQLADVDGWTLSAHAKARDAIIADLTSQLQAARAEVELRVPGAEHAAVVEELESTKRGLAAAQRAAEAREAAVSLAQAGTAELERRLASREAAREKLAALQASLDESREKAAGLSSQLATAHASLADVRGTLQRKEGVMQRQAARAREMEAELAALRKTLMQQQLSLAARAGLERGAGAVGHGPAKGPEASSRASLPSPGADAAAIATLRREKASLERAASAAEGRAAEVEAECTRLTTLLEQLRGNDVMAALRGTRAQLRQCTAQLGRETAARSQAETAASAACADLRQALEDKEGMERLLREASLYQESLSQRLAQSEQALASMRAENAKLQGCKQGLAAAEAAAEDAARHAAELSLRNEEALARLRAMDEHLLEHRRQIQHLESTVTALTSEREEANKACEALHAELERKKELLATTQHDMEAQERQRRRALESTASELEACQQRCEALVQSRQEAEEELVSLRSRALELGRQLAEEQGCARAAERERAGLEAQLAAQQEALSRSREEHACKLGELQAAHAEEVREAVCRAGAALQSRIQQLEEECAAAAAAAATKGSSTPTQGNEQGPPHRSTPTQTMPQPCALHSTSCWAAALPGQRQPMAGGCCLMAGPLEAQVPPMPGANTAACTAEEARAADEFESLLAKLEDIHSRLSGSRSETAVASLGTPHSMMPAQQTGRRAVAT